MEAKETENPSSTMPTRSSFLVTRPSCLLPDRGSTPRFAAATPEADRPGEDPDLRDEAVSEHRPAEPEGHHDQGNRDVDPGGAGCVRRSPAGSPAGSSSSTVGRVSMTVIAQPATSRRGSAACNMPPSTSSSASAPGHSPYPEAGLRCPTGPMSMNRLPQASARAAHVVEVAQRVVGAGRDDAGEPQPLPGKRQPAAGLELAQRGVRRGQRPGQVRRGGQQGPAHRQVVLRGPSARW